MQGGEDKGWRRGIPPRSLRFPHMGLLIGWRSPLAGASSGTEAGLEITTSGARPVVALVRPNGGPAAPHAVAGRCGRFGLCSQDAAHIDWVGVQDASLCVCGTKAQDQG